MLPNGVRLGQWCKAAVEIEAGITSLLPLSDPSLFSHVLSDSLLRVPRVLTVLANAESSMPSMLRLHSSRSITSISPCQAYTTAPRTLALTPKAGPRATRQSNTRLSRRRLWSKTSKDLGQWRVLSTSSLLQFGAAWKQVLVILPHRPTLQRERDKDVIESKISKQTVANTSSKAKIDRPPLVRSESCSNISLVQRQAI